MKSVFLPLSVFAVFSAATLHAQNFAAIWQGTLPPNAFQQRVVLEIAKKEAGGWQVAACSVEFMHDDPHIDSLAVDDSDLKLAFNAGAGSFAGTLSADGASLAGTWTLDHQSYPLVLHRTAAQAAWHTPFLYQYHHNRITYLRPSPGEPKIPFTPKLALAYMEQGAEAWSSDWKCVACHTNGSYMVVRPMLTPELGPPQKAMHDFFLSALREEEATDPADLRPDQDSGQAVYIAAGLAIWDAHVTHTLSPETVSALNIMFKVQRPEGDWTLTDDNNPPLESNRFQLETVAARAMANAPGWLALERGTPLQAKIELVENYLRADHKMQGDYDRTDLLWTAAELPGLLDAQRKQQIVDMILSHQHADGGWSIRNFATPEQWGKGNRAAKLRAEPELNNPPSDGHMTGLAIIALRKGGVPAADPRIQRGIHWLLTNQRASGRWYTRSLNRDGWQFITYSGTLYPLLALAMCNALPPVS